MNLKEAKEELGKAKKIALGRDILAFGPWNPTSNIGIILCRALKSDFPGFHCFGQALKGYHKFPLRTPGEKGANYIFCTRRWFLQIVWVKE